MQPLQVDKEQLRMFVDSLFRYADEGTFISLRVFSDDKDGPPIEITSVEITHVQ